MDNSHCQAPVEAGQPPHIESVCCICLELGLQCRKSELTARLQKTPTRPSRSLGLFHGHYVRNEHGTAGEEEDGVGTCGQIASHADNARNTMSGPNMA
eukprot:520523-Rhodomonas_salina.4